MNFFGEPKRKGFFVRLTFLVSLAQINPIEGRYFPKRQAEEGRRTLQPTGDSRQREKLESFASKHSNTLERRKQ
jgi:hypothetical protein